MRIFIYLALIVLIACEKTTMVGNNTFVHDSKVYRVIDTEIMELGNLKTDIFTRSEVLNSSLREFDKKNMDFVKDGAYTNLSAVYRGDILYFKLDLYGLNSLRSNYRGGGLTINFLDDYGFILHDTYIEMTNMVRIIGANNETNNFEFNGKSQMSSEVYTSIVSYSVSSSLQERY
ncbi:hypothetical protein [Fulvivirga sp.]|uniref:hypothetical protein n=1 Tax=Fulvivirga sp. TaxID=1931237 RepID=UPI0032EFCDA7